MKFRLLCLLALACFVGFSAPAHAQDGDLENPFDLLGDEQDQETERQQPQTQETERPVVPNPARQDQEVERQTQETEGPALDQPMDTLDEDLLEPFSASGPTVQDQETEAPLDRDPQETEAQDQETEAAAAAEQQLEPQQRQEVEDIAQTAEETADTIQDMEGMSAQDAEALVTSEEALAQEEHEATQQAIGATGILHDQVARGEPGYGTMVPVPSHENGAVAEDQDNEGGKGMHSFWEKLLDSALQGVVDGFQRRYAVAKLNQMKARADRAALLGKAGDRPYVNLAVRRAVSQTGLTRLGNTDPRLSDLMLGRNRSNSNPLRATSGGPNGTSGNQVHKIDQYRLPTAHDKITGKPLMRADGVTPIKTVNLPLGSAGGAIPLRRR